MSKRITEDFSKLISGIDFERLRRNYHNFKNQFNFSADVLPCPRCSAQCVVKREGSIAFLQCKACGTLTESHLKKAAK